MDIGIIGSGHIGGTLARRFAALGHHVRVANSRGLGSLAALAAETGATASTVEEAARARDLVVVTIPQRAVPGLPRGLFAECSALPSRPVVRKGDPGQTFHRRLIEPGAAAIVDERARSSIAKFCDGSWRSDRFGRPRVDRIRPCSNWRGGITSRPRATPRPTHTSRSGPICSSNAGNASASPEI